MLVICTEQEQKEMLEKYNKDNQKEITAPFLLRNANTGWPLLQVSHYKFRLTKDDVPIYSTPVYGYTQLYSYPIAFNFSCLLATVSKAGVFNNRKKGFSNSFFSNDVDALAFTKPYFFCFYDLDIYIASRLEKKGYTLEINMPGNLNNPVFFALDQAFEFSKVKHSKLLECCFANRGTWQENCSSRMIETQIDKERAIFHDGQIYVDLGMLFKHSGMDKDALKWFRELFKVDEFMHVMESTHAFELEKSLVI